MGDIADMLYEQMERAMMDGDNWDDDYEPQGTRIKCNRCRTRNLWWHHTGARWRLIDNSGNFHSCTRPPTDDDFEDVS